MLQQEVKKALQEGCRRPPEGFDERSDAQLLRLAAEGRKAGRRMPRAAVVLCTVLLVLGIATALAATVESVNAKLYSYWPELAELLMPVDADCESLGIRMEVESAVVKDNRVMILYSMQDLEGDRLNAYTDAAIDQTVFPLADTKSPSIDSTSLLLSYDAAEKKAVYAQSIEYNKQIRSTDRQIPLRVATLYTKEVEVTDLHPLLAEYGEAAVIPASEENILMIATLDQLPAEQVPDSLKLLDRSRNREIPIGNHTALSGIGWIDGLLHVQLHYTDNDPVPGGEEGGVLWPAVFGHVLMQLADGWSPCYEHRDKLPDGICCIGLGEDGDNPEWQEYIFPCDRDEVREGTLEAQITLNETRRELNGNWSVEVPLRMIRNE